MRRAAGLDERGAVFAEYVVLLSLVSLGCALAIVSIGPALVRVFLVQQAVLMLPLPV